VALVTIDTGRNVFRCEAVTASVETCVQVGYGRSLGSGIVGLVAATGEPELIDDVSTREDYIETAPGVRSELCVPVKHHGKLVAVLNVESTRLAAFHGELPVLTFVADQIAGAIASAQRYEELQQRVRLMEMMSEVSRTALEASDVAELLQRVESYIADHFPLRSVSIEQCSDIPPSSSETGLVVPIRFHDSIVGALKLEADSPEVFSGANAVAFHAFANQIAGAIRLAEMAAQLEEKTRALEAANSHLEVISTHDGLTGLANRRHFDETLQLEWRRAARSGDALSMLLMDIDWFKNFNDAHGHQAGDDVLRNVSRTVLTCVHRAADLVAR
jgi:GAF domain-containing protein